MRVNQSLINAKYCSEFVPGINTVSSLTSLVIKSCFIPFISEEKIQNNHYFNILKKESYSALVIKTIPFISMLCARVQVVNRFHKLVDECVQDPRKLNEITHSGEIPTFFHYEIIHDVLSQNGLALEYVPEIYKDDEDLNNVAVLQDRSSIRFVGPKVIKKMFTVSQVFKHLTFEQRLYLKLNCPKAYEYQVNRLKYLEADVAYEKDKFIKNIKFFRPDYIKDIASYYSKSKNEAKLIKLSSFLYHNIGNESDIKKLLKDKKIIFNFLHHYSTYETIEKLETLLNVNEWADEDKNEYEILKADKLAYENSRNDFLTQFKQLNTHKEREQLLREVPENIKQDRIFMREVAEIDPLMLLFADADYLNDPLEEQYWGLNKDDSGLFKNHIQYYALTYISCPNLFSRSKNVIKNGSSKALNIQMIQEIIIAKTPLSILEFYFPRTDLLKIAAKNGSVEELKTIAAQFPRVLDFVETDNEEILQLVADRREKTERRADVKTKVTLKSSFEKITSQVGPGSRCIVIGSLLQGKHTSSCGAHSLKNAIAALIVSKGVSVAQVDKIFENKQFYKQIEQVIRSSSENHDPHRDFTESDLRTAWNFILENEMIEGIGGEDKENLSFLNTGNEGVTIQNEDSFDSLVHLKKFIKDPGPAQHAIVIGHRGHWSTIYVEKDEKGALQWYQMDSLYDDYNRGKRLVSWIEDAMTHIDHFSLKLHEKQAGDQYRRQVQKLKNGENLESGSEKIFIPLIEKSIQLIEAEGWIKENPVSNIAFNDSLNNIRLLLEHYKNNGIEVEKAESLLARVSQGNENPSISYSPLDVEAELYKLGLPLGKTQKTSLQEFLAIDDDTIPKAEFLHFLNQNFDDEERELQLKLALVLIRSGYRTLFNKTFVEAPEHQREGNWKILTSLLLMGLISEDSGSTLEAIQSILNNELPLEQNLTSITELFKQEEHKVWSLNNLETIRHRITNEPNALQTSMVSQRIQERKNLFFYLYESPEYASLDYCLKFNLDNTTITSLKNLNPIELEKVTNPWSLYEHLKLMQEDPIKPRIKTVSFEENKLLFKPSAFQRKKHYRRDLISQAGPELVKTLFNQLEARIVANPLLAEELLNAAGEESSKEGNKNFAIDKFKSFKTRFFQDGVMADFMKIDSDEASEISEESYQFYTLIQDCLSRNGVPPNPNSLSDQEKFFYYYLNAIDGCATGKRNKLRELSRELIAEKKENSEETKETNPLLSFFSPLFEGEKGYQNYAEDFFNNLERIKEKLKEKPKYWDENHQKEYLRNRFSNLLGLHRDVRFDWHAFAIHKEVRKLFLFDILPIVDAAFKEYYEQLPEALNKVYEELNTTFKHNQELVELVSLYNQKRLELENDPTKREAFENQKAELFRKIEELKESPFKDSVWTEVTFDQPTEGEPKCEVKNMYPIISEMMKSTNQNFENIFDIEWDDDCLIPKFKEIKKEGFIFIAEALGVFSKKPLKS